MSKQRARLLRGSQVSFLIDDVFMFSDLLLVVKTEIFDDSSYNDIIKVALHFVHVSHWVGRSLFRTSIALRLVM